VHTSDRGSCHPTPLVSDVGVTVPSMRLLALRPVRPAVAAARPIFQVCRPAAALAAVDFVNGRDHDICRWPRGGRRQGSASSCPDAGRVGFVHDPGSG